MSRFVNDKTKVVVSVADSKDHRFPASAGWSPVTDDDTTPAPEGYAALKLPELRAEIDKRNEGRADEDKVSAAGNKPDLVAALEADDAKS